MRYTFKGRMPKISQISDDFFTVRSYILDDGYDAIESWYGKRTPEVQAAFEVVLATLRGFPRKWWRGSVCEKMGQRGQDACVGLSRIKVVHREKDGTEEQWRILAFEEPEAHQITLLMAFEKSADPDYSKSCPEGQARKLKVQSDENRSRVCRL